MDLPSLFLRCKPEPLSHQPNAQRADSRARQVGAKKNAVPLRPPGRAIGPQLPLQAGSAQLLCQLPSDALWTGGWVGQLSLFYFRVTDLKLRHYL